MHWEGGLSNCIIATRLRLGCLRTFTFRLLFLVKYFQLTLIHHLMISLIVLFDRHIYVMIIKVASYGGAICQYWDWKGAVRINGWPTVLLWCATLLWCTTGLWCDGLLWCDVMWCDGLLGQNKLIQNPSRLLDLLIWWRHRWWWW